MSITAHERQVRRTRRRQAGFLALILGSVALVEAKAITAPPTHKLNVAGSPAPSVGSASAGHRSSAGASGSGTPGRAAATAPARSVTGQPIDIGYGIVQVQLTVQQGQIADVRTLQAPSDGRSGSIASYAIPQLRREVLAAQSTNIDTVSGASYTSDGYARSVQSALDAARA